MFFFFLLNLKRQFPNHSDGTLTSNNLNVICFFPTVCHKRIFYQYVSLVNQYNIHSPKLQSSKNTQNYIDVVLLQQVLDFCLNVLWHYSIVNKVSSSSFIFVQQIAEQIDPTTRVTTIKASSYLDQLLSYTMKKTANVIYCFLKQGHNKSSSGFTCLQLCQK